MDLVAGKAGYIVFKDSKVGIFYSNDLQSTPSAPTLDANNEEAIKCIHGLAKI